MKILILAPHQDDEVILCGSFMKKMIEDGHEIYVVFMTNGDYEKGIGEVRLMEALEVMKLYGIVKNHVIFMGYANEYEENGPHIYNGVKGQTLQSQYGGDQTYGLPDHSEYCFGKYGVHHKYCRENLITDLQEILGEILPDVIFATDVEIHPDHRANSLFLDEVLGQLLKSSRNYHPIVLKKPEYNTAWIGAKDYQTMNNLSAQRTPMNIYVNGQQTQFGNPYIRWNDRIRIPIDRNARTAKKANNIVYQALSLYRSQNAKKHFETLLNSDVVFWNRRTDSLSYRAHITSSSGDTKYLNDFKVIDSTDIRRRKIDTWNIDASIWRPDAADKEPLITIELEDRERISQIVIYQEFCPKSEIVRSTLLFDGTDHIEVGRLEKRKPTMIRFEPISVKKIEYRIEECSNPQYLPGITEIEVYRAEQRRLSFIKFMINENFVYDYVPVETGREDLAVYEVYEDGSSCVSKDWDKYSLTVYEDKENRGKIIEITARENIEIHDKIRIVQRIHMHNRDRKYSWYRKIYFIGTPNHYNMGDHLIALATERFLKKLFPFTEIVEISVNEFDKRLPELRRKMKRYDLIIMQGGGNMGNIYWTNEWVRRQIIKYFAYNKIVIFPETIFYEKNAEGKEDFNRSRRIYRGAKNLTICAREQKSFEIMKAAYPNNHIILTPDIVCSLKSAYITQRKQVKLFFRDDTEKGITDGMQNKIMELLDHEKIAYVFGSMQRFKKGYMGKENRDETTKYKILEIASAKLIITDQLHAMILAVITGTPCLASGRYYYKIKSTYDTWFYGLPYIELIRDEEDVGEQIHRLLLCDGENHFETGDKFSELITCLEE